MEAALLGRSAPVRDFLASGMPVDYANEAGMTTLMGAAHSGDLGLVRELLDRGANIEARDRGSNTPLLHAAQHGHEEVIRFLLERGADPSARTNDGKTDYHSMQVKLDRRFRNGLLLNNSYTLGRARDYVNENTTIANPIGPVLARFGLSIDGE